MLSAQDLEFGILGPLEVRRGGVPVPVRGRRERAVLTVLLLADGDAVAMDRLVETVWDGNPPHGAVKAVRNCVSALRCRVAESDGAIIPVEPAALGYRLRLEGCAFDLREFRRQSDAARGQAAAGEHGHAVTGLRAALGLWRGPALGGEEGRVLQAGAAHLEEQRMTVLEDCLDLELALGRHRQVAGELHGLVREHPLRERIAGQLMLALYRSSRQAEALDTYHQLVERLAEDLGIDPSAELVRLHGAILRQESSADFVPVPGASVHLSARTERSLTMPRPAQLPLDAPGFTGRSAELARLHALVPLVGRPGPGAQSPVILAIVGTAGIGKTSLALQFAHRISGRYPDGQLYVNLRGFDPSGSPLAPGDALRRFLVALGAVAETIPVDAEEQAALFRSLLAGKRVLVLADNARDAAQVRPLLPGSPGCMVIVTSRSQLTGLVVAEGASVLTLNALGEQEARSLLANRLGSGRVDAERDAAEQVCRSCGGLPLALAIVAARAADQPGVSLEKLAAELWGAPSRLDVLSTGDPATDLRTVFSWSCQQLDEPAARMFRLLGLHPGPDITSPAAASLAGLKPAHASELLMELTRRNLVAEHLPGRFTFHDLLREYAISLASGPDASDDPRLALGRLLDHYLSTATLAMNLLYPAEAHRRLSVRSGDLTQGLDSPQAALTWLDAERACLVAVTALAATRDWPGHAVGLSSTLEQYLECGHYPEGLRIHSHARDAARLAGDRDGEAGALRAFGALQWRMGSRETVGDHLSQALALHRDAGNMFGQARCLLFLGSLQAAMGNDQTGLDCLRQSLAMSRQVGDGVGEFVALSNLAESLRRTGRDQQAAEHLYEALALAREQGDRNCEAQVMWTLGEVEQCCGRPELAAGYYRDALEAYRRLGDLRGHTWATADPAAIYGQHGDPEQTDRRHRIAIVLARGVGGLGCEGEAINGLGEDGCTIARAAEALSHHTAALALARDTDNLEEQARSYAGLGQAHAVLGHTTLARENLHRSFDLYTRLGDLTAAKIGAHLART